MVNAANIRTLPADRVRLDNWCLDKDWEQRIALQWN